MNFHRQNCNINPWEWEFCKRVKGYPRFLTIRKLLGREVTSVRAVLNTWYFLRWNGLKMLLMWPFCLSVLISKANLYSFKSFNFPVLPLEILKVCWWLIWAGVNQTLPGRSERWYYHWNEGIQNKTIKKKHFSSILGQWLKKLKGGSLGVCYFAENVLCNTVFQRLMISQGWVATLH